MKYTFFSSFALILFFSLFFIFSQTSQAVTECPDGFDVLSGVCVPTETGLSEGADPANPIWSVLDTFLKWILSIFGIIAIIAFVVSGIMYLTSGGDENQIDSAKRYMIWSIVGVITALSGLIIIYAVDAWLNGNSLF
ncbi:MAG: hypothetical protein IPN70_02190 [Candidatus Moraniibacteriota bacterium]|nr:MAG: hypothetical protein IPN70_02190 [Candidatus Moranbacteria bacterium]